MRFFSAKVFGNKLNVTTNTHPQWTVSDFGSALASAVISNADPRFLRKSGRKILCNGFWRGGDKQNVCVWPETATWHDLKTGEGGGVSKFAKVAFGCSLKEFMDRFGQNHASFQFIQPTEHHSKKSPSCSDYKNSWTSLKHSGFFHSLEWLRFHRGIHLSHSKAKMICADLTKESFEYFKGQQKSFVKKIGMHEGFISPVRNLASQQVCNFMIRFTNNGLSPKALFLPGAPVAKSFNDAPNVFGNIEGRINSTKIILCEGLTDTLAAEALCNDDEYLVIGAPSANSLPHLGKWLAHETSAHVSIVFHIDKVRENICADAIGQSKALEAAKHFRYTPERASFFAWSSFLEALEASSLPNAFGSIFDLADACELAQRSSFQFQKLQGHFLSTVKRGENRGE